MVLALSPWPVAVGLVGATAVVLVVLLVGCTLVVVVTGAAVGDGAPLDVVDAGTEVARARTAVVVVGEELVVGGVVAVVVVGSCPWLKSEMGPVVELAAAPAAHTATETPMPPKAATTRAGRFAGHRRWWERRGLSARYNVGSLALAARAAGCCCLQAK